VYLTIQLYPVVSHCISPYLTASKTGYDQKYIAPGEGSHQDSAGIAPSGTPPLAAAGTAAPTATDTGKTVPQRANPTETAYAHPRRGTGTPFLRQSK